VGRREFFEGEGVWTGAANGVLAGAGDQAFLDQAGVACLDNVVEGLCEHGQEADWVSAGHAQGDGGLFAPVVGE
jgi:hypothetical protein